MRNQKWTQFFDMSSGGYEKTDFSVIWVEAGEDEAVDVFEEVFGLDPSNVTCSCCGRDFIIDEYSKPEIEDGQAVISREDINRLRAGYMLEVQK